jgi:AcrR family transcriptional regulator
MARKRLTREEMKAATRAALLESVSRVFVARGFDAASIEEISEGAGYSRGAFYANFTSKEECFMELLEQRSSRHLGEIAAAFTNGDAPGERLEAGGTFLDEHLRREREWCRLYMEAWSLASRHPELRRRFADQYAAWRHGVAQTIREQSADANRLDDRRADVIASALVALFEGYMLQDLIDPEALPDDFFAQVLGLLFVPLAEAERR